MPETLTPNGCALFKYPEYDETARKLNHDVPGIIVTTLHPYAYDMGTGPHYVVRRADGVEMAVRSDQLTPIDDTVLDAMTDGFVTAMLWTDAIPIDMGDDGETGGLEDRDPTPELREQARLLCARFYARAGDADIDAHMEVFGDPDGGHPGEYVGHTFYLDAGGHGVSFTDRAWREDDPMTAVGERLRDAAHTFPEVEHLSAFELADGTVGI